MKFWDKMKYLGISLVLAIVWIGLFAALFYYNILPLSIARYSSAFAFLFPILTYLYVTFKEFKEIKEAIKNGST